MTRARMVRALVALVAISFAVLAAAPAALALEVTLNSQHARATVQVNGIDSVVAEIVYRSNTGLNGTSAPKNRTLDGSSWTAAAEQATAGSSIRAVRMAWSPVTADERIFVTQSSDGWLDAYVCNTTCIVTNDIGQVWSTAPGTPERRFDVAYEQLSGGALLVYGVLSSNTTRDIAYRTYSGGAWSAEQYVDDAGETTDVQYTLIILASKRSGDQIGLVGADTTNNDVNAWIWDGGAFGSFVEVNAGAENPDEYQAAIAWESGSGNLVAVSVDSGTADCRSRQFTSDWSADTIFTCGGTSPVRWLSLKPNPVSTADDMVLAVGDNGADLSTVYWDGAAWSALVSQDPGIDFTNARSFDFAWEDTGSKGLLIWGTRSGQITYSAFTAPSTWRPPVDIFQTGDHELVLKAELPDMSRQDIDINIENFVLTIKGEKKVSTDVKDEQFHHVERRYGTFSRSFSLPQTVDPNRVSAEYKNGVLTVRLPLREDAKPRSIKVDVAA